MLGKGDLNNFDSWLKMWRFGISKVEVSWVLWCSSVVKTRVIWIQTYWIQQYSYLRHDEWEGPQMMSLCRLGKNLVLFSFQT